MQKGLWSLCLLASTLCANTHSVCEVERADSIKAKESIEAILAKEPLNISCMLQLANIYLKQGKIAKGFEILVDAYAIDPHRVQSAPIVDVLPFALKVDNLKRQASQTGDSTLWNQLGDGYAQTGIFAEAISMYQQSLLLDPKQHEVRIKLALSLHKNCQTYRALEELKKVLEYYPQHVYANYYMGKLLMHDLNNHEEATYYLTEAKRALKANQQNFAYVEYTNLLSDIARELGE